MYSDKYGPHCAVQVLLYRLSHAVFRNVQTHIRVFLDTLWHCTKLKICGVRPEVKSDEAEEVARCFVSATVDIEMLLC